MVDGHGASRAALTAVQLRLPAARAAHPTSFSEPAALLAHSHLDLSPRCHFGCRWFSSAASTSRIRCANRRPQPHHVPIADHQLDRRSLLDVLRGGGPPQLTGVSRDIPALSRRFVLGYAGDIMWDLTPKAPFLFCSLVHVPPVADHQHHYYGPVDPEYDPVIAYP